MQPRALVFDVFGTVVDWRSSITREGKSLSASKGLKVDWAAFADAWRAGYKPAMDRVRKGTQPWTNLDALHRANLEELLPRFGLPGLSEVERDHLNRVWHRLAPWPDSVAGLTRLKSRHVIAPLSNGNVALLTNMGKHAGLPWDCVLSAELFRHYKPDPEVYTGAAQLLGLHCEAVMMVAAHAGDLRAAQACGMQTAYVHRPLEHGPEGLAKQDVAATGEFDLHAADFIELAAKLGC